MSAQCVLPEPGARHGRERRSHPGRGRRAGRSRLVAARAVRPDDLFSITFTSGTSAQPKGVVHTVGSLLENARCFNESLGLTESNRWLHVMTMGYMAGFLNTLLCPFAAGASVVLCRRSARRRVRFWAPVLEHRADTFWLSPTMAAALVALDRDPGGPRYAREHLRACASGPRPWTSRSSKTSRPSTARRCSRVMACPGCCSCRPARRELARRQRGQAPARGWARMLDERGRPTSAEGEIHIRTPQLMAATSTTPRPPRACSSADRGSQRAKEGRLPRR